MYYGKRSWKWGCRVKASLDFCIPPWGASATCISRFRLWNIHLHVHCICTVSFTFMCTLYIYVFQATPTNNQSRTFHPDSCTLKSNFGS